jgi:sRNA-binding protein
MNEPTRRWCGGLAEKQFSFGSVTDPKNIDSPPPDQAQSKRQRRKLYADAARKTLLILHQRFPATFVALKAKVRPALKIGIRDDIIAALPELDTIEVGRAMGFYVCHPAYAKHCIEGAQRIGLDGKVAGIVTADEARWPAKAIPAQPRPVPPQATPAPAPAPPAPSAPKRVSLADLRAAAAARKVTGGAL